MPFEELVWGALALLIVGILCYSIFKELREDTRLIRDREDWIDTIFRKIPYPSSIFYVDANCIIQYANDEFGKLRGFMCRDEILGKTPEEILGVEKSIIRGVLETGEVIINRRRDPIINYKGEILHHLISCIPIKNKVGKIIGALETLTNITKRVNQEELTHSILKNIPYPSSLFFVDTNCIISYASDEFAKLRGFAKGEDVIGKEPEEILGVEKSIIRGVIGRDKAIINQIRGPIIDYKGNKLYHLISCIPIKDSGGKLLGALEVLTDITELKKTRRTYPPVDQKDT
ncbi:MAG: PAS domain-containing protein [Methanophagales archaeon]|nr:PAS domain-containing protein [Methanophagales archaeon]